MMIFLFGTIDVWSHPACLLQLYRICLTIPNGPTFWNSLVIIIGMTFMPIHIVAAVFCPYAHPPTVLPFSIFLKWWQSGKGSMWHHWLDFKGLHLASSVCIHYARHREQLLRNGAVTSAHHHQPQGIHRPVWAWLQGYRGESALNSAGRKRLSVPGGIWYGHQLAAGT